MTPKPCECGEVVGRAKHVNLELLVHEVNRLRMEQKDADAACKSANDRFAEVDQQLRCAEVLLRYAQFYVKGEPTPDVPL